MTATAGGPGLNGEANVTHLGEMLGHFVAKTQWEALDEQLRHQAKRCVLNYFGCSIAARRAPEVERVIRVMGQFSAPDGLTLVGRQEGADAPTAAFVNAMTANFFDFDDTHASTVIHPTAPVLASALAMGEMLGASGAAVLHAFILGAEVACRIGKAVSPTHYARGWHITSTCGVFGATAAAAHLLGLDARQTWMALGIASSQSAGSIENLTYFPKNVSVGNAARNGLLSALLAQEGCEAAPAAIEGRFGWAQITGDEIRVSEVIEGLGQSWELFNNSFKPYPTGVVFHSAIDASLMLHSQITEPDAVSGIVLSGHQLLSDRGDRIVRTPADARVSAQHCIAASLVMGRCTLNEFDEVAVADPIIAALRGKIRVEVNADVPLGAAVLHVSLADGQMLEVRRDVALGSLGKPLSDSDLEQKFLRNCAFGAWEPGDLASELWNIDRQSDIAVLLQSFRAVG
jgi:2-methylcitrate dehydratase PrpD